MKAINIPVVAYRPPPKEPVAIARMSAWESPLGIKIIEGWLLHCGGLQDARVLSVKDLVVTLQSNATGKQIFDAEAYVRRHTTKQFELMMVRMQDENKLRVKLAAMRGIGGAT